MISKLVFIKLMTILPVEVAEAEPQGLIAHDWALLPVADLVKTGFPSTVPWKDLEIESI